MPPPKAATKPPPTIHAIEALTPKKTTAPADKMTDQIKHAEASRKNVFDGRKCVINKRSITA